jgi:hypothetical protein
VCLWFHVGSLNIRKIRCWSLTVIAALWLVCALRTQSFRLTTPLKTKAMSSKARSPLPVTKSERVHLERLRSLFQSSSFPDSCQGHAQVGTLESALEISQDDAFLLFVMLFWDRSDAEQQVELSPFRSSKWKSNEPSNWLPPSKRR